MYKSLDTQKLNDRLNCLYNSDSNKSEKIHQYLSSNNKMTILNCKQDKYVLSLKKGMTLDKMNKDIQNLCGEDSELVYSAHKGEKNKLYLRLKRNA